MSTRRNARVVAAIMLAASTAQAAIIHVDAANCPGPGDGSKLDPYCSIQTAIDAAVDTDEIVVAPGTYFEAINFLGKAVWLHSSDGAGVTIIDGTGNFHVVLCVSGEGPATILSGFGITGGNARGAFPDSIGGGMLNNNLSSPTVTNCTFSANAAESLGGGMASFGGSSPTVTNCTFSGNSTYGVSGSGGAMYNGINCNPTVTDCTFDGNTANSGGGIQNLLNSPVLTNCTFIGNMATGLPGRGGGMNTGTGSPTVVNCTFIGNTANRFGGGLEIIGGIATVANCRFIGNMAERGGGLYIINSSPMVTNCALDGNAAILGGGIYNDSASNPTVTSCTFSGNTASMVGGAIFGTSTSSSTVTNCILWDGGDEIWNNGGSPITISYTDVQGGWPGTGNIDTDPLFVDSDNGDFRLSPGSPCIDAGDNMAVPMDIETDLDGNPRFLEIPETPDTGNGTLPIVDMGAYESLGGGCLAVINQEVVCHADGTTFTVNIEGINACTGGTTQVTFTASGGAVGQELCFTALVNDGGFCCSTEICVTIPDCAPAALPSDLNGDGIVGMVDFLALLAAWGSCSDCGTCPADFDGDCSVGILDLLILLGNWG